MSTKFTAFPTVYPYLGNGTNVNGESFPPPWDDPQFFPGAPNWPTIIGARSINIGSYFSGGSYTGQSGGVAYICSNDPLTNFAFGTLVGPVGIGLMVDITSNTKSIVLNDNAGTGTDNLLTNKIGLPVELATNQCVTACGWVGFGIDIDNGSGLKSFLLLGNSAPYIFEYNGGYYLPINYSASDDSGPYGYSTQSEPGATTPSGTFTLSGTFGGQFPLYATSGAPTWTAAVVGTGW